MDWIWLLAAEEAVEASQTPFYVAGTLLAVWAVLISVVAIRRPGFPGGRGSERAVMLLSGLLVAAAMVTAVTSS